MFLTKENMDFFESEGFLVLEDFVSLENCASLRQRALAIVETGDYITIDAAHNNLNLELSEEQIQSRLEEWTPPKSRYQRGVLAKYARSVSSASLGAVTDLG